MIQVKDGEIISEIPTGGEVEEEEEEGDKKEEEEKKSKHAEKLIQQQQGIMQNQQQVIQHQDSQLIELNIKIRELEKKNAEQSQQLILHEQQQQQGVLLQQGYIQTQPQVQQLLTPVPAMPSIPEIDLTDLEGLDVPPQPETSTGTSRGAFALENVVKQEHLKFLPKFAVKPEQTETTGQ